ncbi:unnamed protein product [Meganyctiphanes norvegica]|uniref:C2H2-type domain-containing protein n=1 Tax=Meganyctiphanes norvegica TaxID=48144 RepID=A0AAV2PQZ4_MEGNR
MSLSHRIINKYIQFYQCNQCDETFSRKQHAERHMQTHHGEKPYKCKHCDMAFSINFNLQKHCIESHDAIIHSNTISQSSNPKSHVFVCHVCFKTIKTKEDLDIHLVTHGINVVDSSRDLSDASLLNTAKENKKIHKMDSNLDLSSEKKKVEILKPEQDESSVPEYQPLIKVEQELEEEVVDNVEVKMEDFLYNINSMKQELDDNDSDIKGEH